MRPYPKLHKLIFFLVCWCLATGCINSSQFAQPHIDINLYTLEYTPPACKITGQLPVVLKVKDFTAAPLYDSRAIVYRKKQFQTDEYIYHKWHLRPAQIATQLITRDLEQANAFHAVFGPDSAAQASYSLEGHLEKFLENDEDENKWRAELSLDISLCDESQPDINKRIVSQKRYSATEECRRKNPTALAEAMSAAMKTISTQLIADTYQTIHQQLEQAKGQQ